MVPGMGVCLVLRVILRTHARITSHCCTTKLCSPKTLHNKRCTGQIRARGGLTDRVCTSVPALGSCTTTIFPPVVGAAANCRNLDHTHRGWRCTEVSERQDNACQDRYILSRRTSSGNSWCSTILRTEDEVYTLADLVAEVFSTCLRTFTCLTNIIDDRPQPGAPLTWLF